LVITVASLLLDQNPLKQQVVLSAAPPFRTTGVTAAAAEISGNWSQIHFRFDRNHCSIQDYEEQEAGAG